MPSKEESRPSLLDNRKGAVTSHSARAPLTPDRYVWTASERSPSNKRRETHVDSLLGARLLEDSDGGIGDEDEHNDEGLDERRRPRLGLLEEGEHEGHDGRAKEDEDELVLKLGEDQLEEGGRRLLWQLCDIERRTTRQLTGWLHRNSWNARKEGETTHD